MKRPAAASHAAKAARARPAAVDSVADSVESSSEPQELSTFSLRLPGLNVRPEFATALCTGFKEIEVRYGSTRLALDALVMSPTSSARRAGALLLSHLSDGGGRGGPVEGDCHAHAGLQ